MEGSAGPPLKLRSSPRTFHYEGFCHQKIPTFMWRSHEITPAQSVDAGPAESPAPENARVPKRRRGWRVLVIILLVLVVLLGVARAFLPWAVRDYVNRTLDRNPLYDGQIGQVQIHL